MFLKWVLSSMTAAAFFSTAWAAEADLDSFCKKYGISPQELVQFERAYLDSDLGLKRLTGLRSQLKEFTNKEIDQEDLLQFAGDFSKKMDSLAESKLTEFGGSFGLNQKHYDKALDESLDEADGKDPKAFLKTISKSLVKSASQKLPEDKALSLAKSLQIRMDMTMMKSHLKDADYMNRLLGEHIEVFLKPTKGPSGRPGSVQ